MLTVLYIPPITVIAAPLILAKRVIDHKDSFETLGPTDDEILQHASMIKDKNVNTCDKAICFYCKYVKKYAKQFRDKLTKLQEK